jgi:hypothetical protein
MMGEQRTLTSAALTTPRAAAAAGIVFSVLMIPTLALVRMSVPANLQDAGEWLSRNWRTVRFALNLVPFAGIAFLWFIGVLRDRIGAQEDRFFATVFLGSGLLFLAMLFVSSAVAGGVIAAYGMAPSKLMDSNVYAFGRIVTYQLMHVYTLKMAGMFMISTCTVSLRIGIIPRWMLFLGFALALLLLLSHEQLYWVPLVFPLWILLISGYILVTNLRPAQASRTEQL